MSGSKDYNQRATIGYDNVARTDPNKVLTVIGGIKSGTTNTPKALNVDANGNLIISTTGGSGVSVITATGSAAISFTTTAITDEFQLEKITCHFSSAPTTSQNFVVTLDSNAGAAYDTTLLSVNPSLTATTDIVYIPNTKFVSGDKINITFTNTDTRTYGLSLYYSLI